MPRILRIAGYIFLGLFAFAFFLYWSFPYDSVKERVIVAAEQQLGGDYALEMNSLSPSFFTGITMKGVKLLERGADGTSPVWEADKIKFRVSLLSLLFGATKGSLTIVNKRTDIDADFSNIEDGVNFHADIEDLDLGDLKLLANKAGLNIVSKIDGSIDLKTSRSSPLNNEGKIKLDFAKLEFKDSNVKLGAMGDFNLPTIVVCNGQNSGLDIEISKGSMKITRWIFAGGDLSVNLNGQIFMSQQVENYRVNISGSITLPKKLEDALPFIFLIQQQKKPDGSYPISVTGRLGKPNIKIGDFLLPI